MENKKICSIAQVVIKCPHCGIEVRVPERSVAIECSLCSKKIVLPQGDRLYGESTVNNFGGNL